MSFRTSFGREHFGSQCLYLVYMAGYKFSDFDRSFNSEMKTKERKSSLTSVNKKREKRNKVRNASIGNRTQVVRCSNHCVTEMRLVTRAQTDLIYI